MVVEKEILELHYLAGEFSSILPLESAADKHSVLECMAFLETSAGGGEN